MESPGKMSSALIDFAKLAPLGFVVGLYGTLIGAGGGFVLVPVLLLLMPDLDPATITSTSLAVVFFNSYSGTLAYVRMRRIDYFAAMLFIAAGLPGAVLGPVLAHRIPRGGFEPIFGILLLAAGIWIAWRPLGSVPVTRGGSQPFSGAFPAASGRFNTLLGAIGAAYIGLVSTLFGIGGGVLQVPFLVRALKFPPHVATATSQLVLAVLTLVATICHACLGAFQTGVDRTMILAVGVMMGAPIGALISTRVQGSVLVRMLALALCVAGLRLLYGIL
jgi:uncharacterized membrane protein YfcA